MVPKRKTIQSISKETQTHLYQTHTAREHAFPLTRKVIHMCAGSIRSAHRQDYNQSYALLEQAKSYLQEIKSALKDHPSLYYTGYVSDSQKEYAEAWATLSFLTNTPLYSPKDLGIEVPPYLNGLAEAASELRRSILDALRRNEISSCETWMQTMDEVYDVLVTMDYPDAITGGLRRTTDQLRGVLERTRGDLTMALRQHSLEEKLAEFQKNN